MKTKVQQKCALTISSCAYNAMKALCIYRSNSNVILLIEIHAAIASYCTLLYPCVGGMRSVKYIYVTYGNFRVFTAFWLINTFTAFCPLVERVSVTKDKWEGDRECQNGRKNIFASKAMCLLNIIENWNKTKKKLELPDFVSHDLGAMHAQIPIDWKRIWWLGRNSDG